MHVWRITLSHLSCCVKYRKTWRLITQTCKFNLIMLKLIHHTKSNHTCNMEREGEAVWSKGGLGSSCNPMFGSPWLRFSSSEHPGCRMLCIRPACGKLLALSMLCLPPLNVFTGKTTGLAEQTAWFRILPRKQSRIPPGCTIAPGNLTLHTIWHTEYQQHM